MGMGVAPVALAAHSPILEAEGDGSLAEGVDRGDLLKLLLRLITGQAIELAGVDEATLFGNEGKGWLLGGRIERRDNAADRDGILRGEFKVALIVRGHTHDGAGAVVHEDVVGHPDGHLFAVVRIDGKAAGGHTMLFNRANVAGFLGFFCSSMRAETCTFRPASAAAKAATKGCSGASWTLVAPKMVSTRVVKTRILSAPAGGVTLP